MALFICQAVRPPERQTSGGGGFSVKDSKGREWRVWDSEAEMIPLKSLSKVLAFERCDLKQLLKRLSQLS